MPNTIKRSGNGFALQVTTPARTAGLVEEADNEPARFADIRVFAFDGLLLVVDIDRITDESMVELATTAALDTVSIHRVARLTPNCREWLSSPTAGCCRCRISRG